MIGVVFICKAIPCSTSFFISTVFNHSSTENVIWQESVMDSFVVPLYASLFQIIGQIIFSTSWKFAISVTMRSSLLYDVFWNGKKVQCIFNETLDWPLFLLRDARMCNRRCLHSNMMGMLCTASWSPSRAIQTILRCPRPESSVLIPD